jgi:hypothetical protein
MKHALLLLTASLVIVSSGAFAQGKIDACHSGYGSCMERCSTRPAPVQESCSSTCEATTNQCYSQMYGPKSAGAEHAGGGRTVFGSGYRCAKRPRRSQACRQEQEEELTRREHAVFILPSGEGEVRLLITV